MTRYYSINRPKIQETIKLLRGAERLLASRTDSGRTISGGCARTAGDVGFEAGFGTAIHSTALQLVFKGGCGWSGLAGWAIMDVCNDVVPAEELIAFAADGEEVIYIARGHRTVRPDIEHGRRRDFRHGRDIV